MHDIRILSDQLDSLRSQLGARAGDIPWETVQTLAAQRRVLITQTEELRHQLKKGSDQIAELKRNKQPCEDATTALREIRDRIQTMDVELRTTEEQLQGQALRIPNIPHESVPPGKDEHENIEVRKWGIPPEFSFPAKSHQDLGEALGILDFKRATKIAGARFCVSMGLGALLERALANFMLDCHIQEHGYTEVLPPMLVNRPTMTGTGQLPKFAEDLFHFPEEDFFLIPTAEVPVTNLLREEILDAEQLPLRLVAYTSCFRREAGSYGKDTQGLIRMHQFQKVELVNFVRPEDSYDQLERLTQAAESILQKLALPYRVVALCSGDLGFSAAKTYDLEVWLPSQQRYREISSCSNFEAFQARRANIRFRSKKDKPQFLHTLNGSGLAIGRTVVAILENYQQADGTVHIPEALQPYMKGVDVIRPVPFP
ncbi:serine--tRNA ligase [Candidatus Nitrospira allomarina]|jgi:seryl-tRNA synthetase|uniref:Serine--tRNA ligase n=1 Tax=Candidatus Nitrospira allomarina TaxID=3020900 RepID=A0AA96G917_9BACT|nr:serine--tRNA ligase [Candidatus Nitrospira allomarina]WNM57126.1 serine--tRNA ligase [Candidatus Nitrospira allomarina]